MGTQRNATQRKMSDMAGNCDPSIYGDGLCPGSNWQWYEIVGVVFMVEWGIIHVAAMVVICMPASRNDGPGWAGVYDNLSKQYPSLVPQYEKMTLPPLASRIVLQHGINLGWCGLWALLAPALMSSELWNRFTFMWCLVPYMADLAYWISLDVPELVGTVGQAQTYIVSAGLFCIGYGVNERWKNSPAPFAPTPFETGVMYGIPCVLFGLGVLQKLTGLCGLKTFGFLLCESVPEESENMPDESAPNTGTV